jgi:hypothetical protein
MEYEGGESSFSYVSTTITILRCSRVSRPVCGRYGVESATVGNTGRTDGIRWGVETAPEHEHGFARHWKYKLAIVSPLGFRVSLSFVLDFVFIFHLPFPLPSRTRPHHSLHTSHQPKPPHKSKMCMQKTCPTCQMATWWGCGQHIPSVMDKIPESDRCTCGPKREVEVCEFFFFCEAL